MGRDSTSTPNAPSVATCKTCRTAVTASQKGVECEVCKTWYHIQCQKLSVTDYNALQRGIPGCCWFCSNCKSDDFVLSLRESNSLKDQVAALTAVVAQNQEAVTKLTETINLLLNNSAAATPPTNGPSDIQSEISEGIERDRKKLNLVIVGLPETDTASIRPNGDRQFVDSLATGLSLPTDHITDVFRDGMVKTSDDPARPYSRILKVKFGNMTSRIQFLKNFRQSKPPDTKFRGTYVRPDLTARQRAADKILKDELRHRREAEPEADLIIRRGKIIPRPRTSRSDPETSG